LINIFRRFEGSRCAVNLQAVARTPFEAHDPEYESAPISVNVESVYATTHRNIPGDVDG